MPSISFDTYIAIFGIENIIAFVLIIMAIIFAFLFVDIFDTLGTLIGVASKADMLDEEGRLPNIKGALMADAIATTAGAVLGTSTTTTFVESSAGVSAVPMAARVANKVGMEEDPSNFLLMHAMGPNVAGVIGTAVAAGTFMAIFL